MWPYGFQVLARQCGKTQVGGEGGERCVKGVCVCMIKIIIRYHFILIISYGPISLWRPHDLKHQKNGKTQKI